MPNKNADAITAGSFLHSLLDHIPDPILVKDSSHKLLMANRAFRELTGADGQGYESFPYRMAADGADALWEADAAVLKTGMASVSEQTIADASGKPRLFSIKRTIFSDETCGRVLVGVMRDITAQRRAEENFKEQAIQLMRQSQDLAALGAILDESLQEIFIVDAASLALIQVNKGGRRKLGYGDDEVERIGVLAILPEFSEQRLRALLQPLETGDQVETVFHAAFRRKNGGCYDVEVHAQRTISQGRSVFVLMAIDETERKQMEKMKNEFISTVSHELRTPLTSIRGALGLVCAGTLGELPEKAATMVGIAHSNAERLARLVNDILALEKSLSGKLSIEIREVPVGEFLRHAIEMHAGYSEKFNVEFVLEAGTYDFGAIADPNRLMQVMANLLSNAAKFSTPGSQVLLRAFAQDGSVRFEVEDHGSGISDSFRPHVFERFAQEDTSTARQHEGTGLGLAITRQLVESMGGQIGFESQAGVGTTFFFILPRAIKREGGGSSLEDVARVLICEDDPDIALVMKMALEQAGFETVTAATIQEARRKLSEKTFAVMSLDLGLPDADGLDFLHELRGETPTAGLPVVVVSGRAEQNRQVFRENPANVAWLLKPLDHHSLVHSIRQALRCTQNLPKVLYLGGNEVTTGALAHSLGGVARLVVVKDMSGYYREIRTWPFDLLVADPELDEAQGKELLEHVRSGADDMPPVLVLSESDPDFKGLPGYLVAAAVAARVSATLNQKQKRNSRKPVEPAVQQLTSPTGN